MDEPGSRAPQLEAVLGTFIVLAWIFVSLRVYVKTFVRKEWALDDSLLIVALLFFTAYCASSWTGAFYGTGRHVQDIPLEDIPKALECWWLCEIFYTLATIFIRWSIAVFLLRISGSNVNRRIKYVIYATMAVITIFTVLYFFLVTFQCTPVSHFWLQYAGQEGSCIAPSWVPDSSIAHSVISFTADWVLGLLPIAIIFNLQMNIRTKVSVGILLSLGLLAGLATLIRAPYIHVLALTDDFLYATVDVAIWSTVEPGIGLIACSCTALRPLFTNFYNTVADSTPSTNFLGTIGSGKPASFKRSWAAKYSSPNTLVNSLPTVTKMTTLSGPGVTAKAMDNTDIEKQATSGISVLTTYDVRSKSFEDQVRLTMMYDSEAETERGASSRGIVKLVPGEVAHCVCGRAV